MGTANVMSFGAGKQTTALLLMSIHGDLPPYDLVIFADTQAEPVEVYEHLEKCRALCSDVGVPFVTVTAGSLTDRLLDPSRREGIQIPTFIKGALGRRDGMLRRQCTEKFKSRPVYKWLNGWRERRPVDLTLGISWDEIERMKPPHRKWVTNRYPLVDARMTRHDCIRYIASHGWTAPRSACTYCPYHNDAEWRRMRDEQPADWQQVVLVDRRMREVHAERMATGTTSLTGTPYLHRSLVPLDEVDLSTPEDHGQGTLFGCEDGWCGL